MPFSTGIFLTQRLNPRLFMYPALADSFLTTRAPWGPALDSLYRAIILQNGFKFDSS